jgi:hypothetical protein
MVIQIQPVFDALTSHAQSLGIFDRVGTHEPKNGPGHGLTCGIWADRVSAALAQSGLNRTTAYIVFNLRIYSEFLAEPQDLIDPEITAAVDVLFAAYSGDFTLGGLVRNVDILGSQGLPLSANAGYLNVDGKIYRVMTILLPVIINDIWDQEAV